MERVTHIAENPGPQKKKSDFELKSAPEKKEYIKESINYLRNPVLRTWDDKKAYSIKLQEIIGIMDELHNQQNDFYLEVQSETGWTPYEADEMHMRCFDVEMEKEELN